MAAYNWTVTALSLLTEQFWKEKNPLELQLHSMPTLALMPKYAGNFGNPYMVPLTIGRARNVGVDLTRVRASYQSPQFDRWEVDTQEKYGAGYLDWNAMVRGNSPDVHMTMIKDMLDETGMAFNEALCVDLFSETRSAMRALVSTVSDAGNPGREFYLKNRFDVAKFGIGMRIGCLTGTIKTCEYRVTKIELTNTIGKITTERVTATSAIVKGNGSAFYIFNRSDQATDGAAYVSTLTFPGFATYNAASPGTLFGVNMSLSPQLHGIRVNATDISLYTDKIIEGLWLQHCINPLVHSKYVAMNPVDYKYACQQVGNSVQKVALVGHGLGTIAPATVKVNDKLEFTDVPTFTPSQMSVPLGVVGLPIAEGPVAVQAYPDNYCPLGVAWAWSPDESTFIFRGQKGIELVRDDGLQLIRGSGANYRIDWRSYGTFFTRRPSSLIRIALY